MKTIYKSEEGKRRIPELCELLKSALIDLGIEKCTIHTVFGEWSNEDDYEACIGRTYYPPA